MKSAQACDDPQIFPNPEGSASETTVTKSEEGYASGLTIRGRILLGILLLMFLLVLLCEPFRVE